MFYINRLDNTTWSMPVEPPRDGIHEIRITTPQFDEGTKEYQLASIINSVFHETISQIDRASLKHGVVVESQTEPVQGTWLVSSKKNEWVVSMLFWRSVDWILQKIPLTHSIASQKIVTVYARNISHHPCKKLIQNVICSANRVFDSKKLHADIETMTLPLSRSIEDQLHMPLFADPFSQLAATCLQTAENNFVMETDHRGRYRYVIDGTSLRLKKITASNPSPEEVEENRAAIRFYQRFLLLEFGSEFVDQWCLSYKINFSEMVQKGLPLYPDHVFKCNIGANNIELRYVETLWAKLQTIVKKNSNPTLEEYAELLSVRVLRKLKERCVTLNSLVSYLTPRIAPYADRSIRDVPPKVCEEIITLFWPTPAERDLSFTGRKIAHMAIQGCHTMGDPDTPNPCRDLFELQQIFSDLSDQRDLQPYLELVSHVVSKKTLFRPTPQEESSWHVGLLIPGPTSQESGPSWYVNDKFMNDKRGNVNWGLAPVSRTTSLPAIVVYRSTASDRNAFSSTDSLLDDANPFGPPIMWDPDRGYSKEKKYITERTIPLWVALLLTAQRMRDHRERLLTQACAVFAEYIHQNARAREEQIMPIIKELLEKKQFDALEQQFAKHSAEFQERPDDKLRQKVILTGHSLGGANCEFAMYYHFVHHKRVPLPNCKAMCVAFDPPAIGSAQDRAFMAYGRIYREVFDLLNISIDTHIQCEYGDPIPDGGQSHLATTAYDTQDTWLHPTIRIFRPSENAEALSMTTLPTHGRRTATAVEGKDYSQTPLTPADLAEFDHAIWLSRRIRQVFGNKFLLSPKINECGRRILGGLMYIPLRIRRLFDYQPIDPEHDDVVALEYPKSQCVRGRLL